MSVTTCTKLCGHNRNVYGRAKQDIHVSSAKPEDKNHLGDTDVDGMILLKGILNKQGKGSFIFWLRIGINGEIL